LLRGGEYSDMRCAIIGGGYSGAAVALALLKNLPSGHAITMFEPSREIGRGIAYATGPDHHLLNVAAHTVSITPDDQGGFCAWAVSRFPDSARYREADGAYFFPRSWFGTYVQECLANAIASNPDVTFKHEIAVASSVRHERGHLIVSSSIGEHEFDKVVFAIGNGPPSPIRLLEPCENPIVEQSAWKYNTNGIPKTARIVIVGIGLTMADVIADLEGCGHQGSITCISRNGRRPHVSVGIRAEFTPAEEFPPIVTARELVQAVRRWTDDAVAQGGHWISGVDHVIRNTPTLWRSLPPIERSRLRRHALAMGDSSLQDASSGASSDRGIDRLRTIHAFEGDSSRR